MFATKASLLDRVTLQVLVETREDRQRELGTPEEVPSELVSLLVSEAEGARDSRGSPKRTGELVSIRVIIMIQRECVIYIYFVSKAIDIFSACWCGRPFWRHHLVRG